MLPSDHHPFHLLSIYLSICLSIIPLSIHPSICPSIPHLSIILSPVYHACLHLSIYRPFIFPPSTKSSSTPPPSICFYLHLPSFLPSPSSIFHSPPSIPYSSIYHPSPFIPPSLPTLHLSASVQHSIDHFPFHSFHLLKPIHPIHLSSAIPPSTLRPLPSIPP